MWRVAAVLCSLLVSVEGGFGDVYAWGRGSEGQLGLDNGDQQNFPMPVSAILDSAVRVVDAGKGSTTAVTTDGKVFMWGLGVNKNGVLGPEFSSNIPIRVEGFAGVHVLQFVAGNCHYVALTNRGEVMTWGCADHGATGHGTSCEGCRNDQPKVINSLRGRNIRQVVSGGDHSAALTDNGEVWVWGSGESGEIGNSLFADQPLPSRVESLKHVRICQICAGEDHMAAVDSEGRMYTWGRNQHGQLGHGLNVERLAEPKMLKRFMHPDTIAIATCSFGFTGAITRSNKVFFWGDGGLSLPTEKEFFRGLDARAITAGKNHIVVALKDFRVFTWGSNWQGQLGYSSDGFFTLEPQLIDSFIGKRINNIVAGLNHTVAVSGTPMDLLCPVFQDWYGSPESTYGLFEATCPPDGTTCPDKSCCKVGESCAKFNNQEMWGCCSGEDMRFCEDDFTCCSEHAMCNLVDQVCEVPVSYIDAANFFLKIGSGEAKSVAVLPGMSPSQKGSLSIPRTSEISPPGTKINIPKEALGESATGTNVGSASQKAYAKSGLTASAAAALNEYQKTASQNLKDRAAASVKDAKAGASHSSAATAAPANPGAQAGPSFGQGQPGAIPSTPTGFGGHGQNANQVVGQSGVGGSGNSNGNVPSQGQSGGGSGAGQGSDSGSPLHSGDEDEDVIASPLDAAVERVLEEERIKAMAALSGGDPGDSKDAGMLSRGQIIQSLKRYDVLDRYNDVKLGSKSTTELYVLLKDTQKQHGALIEPQGGDVITPEGQVISGPFKEQILREERDRAKKQPSIEDVEDENTGHVLKEIEVVAVDPTATKVWRDNVRKSEKLAGRPQSKTLEKMNVLRPEDPPLEAGVVAGAGELVLPSHAKHLTPTEIYRLRASGELLQSTRPTIEAQRPGKGPCPRGAGNLDCNRDCADVDAKVIDAAREASELAASIAYAAKSYPGDTARVIDEVDFPRVIPVNALVTPSPSASPSPKLKHESSIITKLNHTIIQERYGNTNLTVMLGNVEIPVPEPGFYIDEKTNQTFKVVGDKLYRASPAAKFTQMGGSKGSFYRGHCGDSRPTCPDNSCCESGESCCQQQDGTYGCCPFEEGTCCHDQRHCCPGDYVCDLDLNQCTHGKLIMGLARFAKVDQGLCDAGHQSCKDGSCCSRDQTCCTMHDGLQGCAPYPDAICCADGRHACPDGSTCDVPHLGCTDLATGLVTRISALEHSSVPPGVSLVCYPDELTCASGSCCATEHTCCEDSNGYDRCCPFSDGVCCGEGLCCPHSYTCDFTNNECVGPDGNTALTPAQVSREPYLVAEACDATESACVGTHDCCKKGEGCCLGFQNNTDGERVPVSNCCPFGEDSVCCEEGACCPFGHACEGDSCISPTGQRIPKGATKVSRKSENIATSTCISSKSLHEEYRQQAKENAAEKQEEKEMLILKGETKLMCPPFCGQDGSQVPVQDTGLWGDENANSKDLSKPGETGLHLAAPISETAEEEKEREKQEMIDEVAFLKLELIRLLSLNQTNMDVHRVRGSILFDCEWQADFRAQYGGMLERALASAAQVPIPNVVLRSVRPAESITVDYLVEVPAPAAAHMAQDVANHLNLALRSGLIVGDLLQMGFPVCISSMKISELPGVEHVEPLKLADKLALMEELEKLIIASGYTTGSDEFQFPPEIKLNLDSLELLAAGLEQMKKSLGTSATHSAPETSSILAKLHQLITLLTGYLEPQSEADAERSAAVYAHAQKELSTIYDKIKAARLKTKCQRASINDPVGPECENTQMSLTAMPLRDVEDPDRYDPTLQKEFGSSLRVPAGIETANYQNPPSVPSYAHEPNMPEECEGGNCVEHL